MNCRECPDAVGTCTRCTDGNFLDNNECRGKADTLFVQEPASIKVRSHCCGNGNGKDWKTQFFHCHCHHDVNTTTCCHDTHFSLPLQSGMGIEAIRDGNGNDTKKMPFSSQSGFKKHTKLAKLALLQLCIPIYLQFPSLFETYDVSKCKIKYQWI